MSHTGIAVVEGSWERKSNASVRGLFDLIAEIATGNRSAYHYEMANSEVALKEAIPRLGSYRECKYLYLAMHGDESGLQTLSGEQLSRAELRNLLQGIHQKSGSRLAGVYLSSCLFHTDRVADFLFQREIGLRWTAGYREEVGWIESSALDLLFFNELLNGESAETELAKIGRVAERLLSISPGLIRRLGFGIYTRKPAVGGVKNLLAAAYT